MKNEKSFWSEIENIFLVLQVLSFRLTKQTSKNVVDTTFNNETCSLPSFLCTMLLLGKRCFSRFIFYFFGFLNIKIRYLSLFSWNFDVSFLVFSKQLKIFMTHIPFSPISEIMNFVLKRKIYICKLKSLRHRIMHAKVQCNFEIWDVYCFRCDLHTLSRFHGFKWFIYQIWLINHLNAWKRDNFVMFRTRPSDYVFVFDKFLFILLCDPNTSQVILYSFEFYDFIPNSPHK